jgi:hypothetical protein
MAKAGYTVTTEGAVALAAAGTAKTILAIIAPAQFGIDLKKVYFSFDGVTASEKPILVEIVRFTTDGTGTAVTVAQAYGPTITAGFTAKKNYGTEPTTPTVLAALEFDPNKGSVIYDWPLAETYDTAVSQVMGVRMTIPTGGAAVNARVTLGFERT